MNNQDKKSNWTKNQQSAFPAAPPLPASFAPLLFLLWCLLARGPRGRRLLLSRGDHVASGGRRGARRRPWSGGSRGAAGRLTGITETEKTSDRPGNILHISSPWNKCVIDGKKHETRSCSAQETTGLHAAPGRRSVDLYLTDRLPASGFNPVLSENKSLKDSVKLLTARPTLLPSFPVCLSRSAPSSSPSSCLGSRSAPSWAATSPGQGSLWGHSFWAVFLKKFKLNQKYMRRLWCGLDPEKHLV